VIIPTRDRPELLAHALASCRHCGLEREQLEIIVVDDGSREPASLAGLDPEGEVRWLRFPVSQGRGAARNAGIAAATGEYLKFLDDDDLLEPEALREEVELARATTVNIVVSSWRRIGLAGENPRFCEVSWTDRGVDSLLAGESVPTGAALYRAAALTGVRWSETLSKLDDWDFFVQAFLAARTVAVRQAAAYTWVEHPGQGVWRATRLQNAQEFYAVLDRIESHLRASHELTEPRRRRLAQYLYKELQALAEQAPLELGRRAEQIESLDPRFVPRDEERRWWVRALCRLLGTGGGLRAYVKAKTFLRPGRST